MKLSASHAAPLLAALLLLVPASLPAAEAPAPDRVDRLIAKLKDPSPQIRKHAIRTLREFKDPRSVAPLIALLETVDPHTGGVTNTYEVQKALAMVGAPAVEPLIAAMKRYENRDVRSYMIFTLGMIKDPRAVEPLIADMLDPTSHTGSNSAQALGMIGDTAAVESLITALALRNHQAATALGRIGDTRAVEPLIAALADLRLRQSAATALGRIGDLRAVEPLINALTEKDPILDSIAAEAAKRLSDPHFLENAPRRPPVHRSSRSPYIREPVIDALGLLADPRALDVLLAELKSTNRDIRYAVVKALQTIPDPRSVPSLVAFLDSSDVSLRHAALRALCAINDPCVVKPLIAQLAGNPGRETISLIVAALANFPDSLPVPILIRFLNNDRAETRAVATRALVAIGTPAVDPLIAAMRENRYSGRLRARKVLAEIGAPAVPALILALETDTAKGDSSCASALVLIGEAAVPTLIDALDDNKTCTGKTPSDVLVSIGEPAVPPLLALFASAPTDARARAARILGRIATPAALDPLINALTDPDPALRAVAAASLSAVRGRSVADALLIAMKDEEPPVRMAAARSLDRLGDRRAEMLFLVSVKNNDLAVVAGAYHYLICEGVAASEPTLIDTLSRYGNENMALFFVECGNSALENAAKEWCQKNNVVVPPPPEADVYYYAFPFISWGSNHRDLADE